MVSHPALADAVSRKCPGNHKHELTMMKNAKIGQVYNEELADAILDAIVQVCIEQGDERFIPPSVSDCKYAWVEDCAEDEWCPPGELVHQVLYLDINRDPETWRPVLDAVNSLLQSRSQVSLVPTAGPLRD